MKIRSDVTDETSDAQEHSGESIYGIETVVAFVVIESKLFFRKHC